MAASLTIFRFPLDTGVTFCLSNAKLYIFQNKNLNRKLNNHLRDFGAWERVRITHLTNFISRGISQRNVNLPRYNLENELH